MINKDNYAKPNGTHQADRKLRIRNDGKADFIKNMCDTLFALRTTFESVLSVSDVQYIDDAVAEIEIGYLKNDDDSSYHETLRTENFEMTFAESLQSLEARFYNTFRIDLRAFYEK